MNVFSAYDESVSRNGVRGGSKAKPNESASTGAHRVIKSTKSLPPHETKAKVDKDEVVVSPKAQKKVQTASEESPPSDKSDITKNDPNDPITKEKLKAAINDGMIKLNDSERSVLKELITD